MDTGAIRFFLLLSLLILLGGLYSFILSLFTRRKIFRYLPTIIGIFLVPYIIFQVYFAELEGFLPLAYLILLFMVMAVILGNILGNTLLNWLNKTKSDANNRSK